MCDGRDGEDIVRSVKPDQCNNDGDGVGGEDDLILFVDNSDPTFLSQKPEGRHDSPNNLPCKYPYIYSRLPRLYFILLSTAKSPWFSFNIFEFILHLHPLWDLAGRLTLLLRSIVACQSLKGLRQLILGSDRQRLYGHEMSVS